MHTARAKIADALATSTAPAVLCSFGKDSMLLLHLVREVSLETPILWFRTGLDESFARRMIAELNLTLAGVLCPSPADVYLLTDGANHTLIHEYDFGGDRLPVLTDLTAGTRCSLTAFSARTPSMFYPFDTLLVGWKDSDSHWVKGSAPLAADGFVLGRSRIIAPLRHLSETAVLEAINTLHIPYQPITDELPLCTHCMTANTSMVHCPALNQSIPRQPWDAPSALAAFRNRFSLED